MQSRLWQEFKQFARYLLVGVMNTAVGYGIIFFCMYGLGVSPVLSNALGYGIGVIVSYSLNKKFTFKSNASDGTTFLRFLLVTAVAYSANLLTLIVLINRLEVHSGVSQIVSGGVYVVTAFLGSKFYAFASQKKIEPL